MPDRSSSGTGVQRSALRRRLTPALTTLAVLYVVYAAFFFSVQRSLLFPLAEDKPVPFATALPAQAQLIEPRVSFGRARGVFLPGPSGVAPALLFFHGNGEIVDPHDEAWAAWRARGLHVLLVELPGYAGADGMPSFNSLREVSLAAYDWLVQQPAVDRQRIVVMGRSVGGAPAAELSRHRAVVALILQSTFSSLADLARERYLPGWLARDPYDSVARVRAFTGPVLILHGLHDTLVGYVHATRLAAASPRTRLIALNCGHNDCPTTWPGHTAPWDEFLREQQLLRAVASTPSAVDPSP